MQSFKKNLFLFSFFAAAFILFNEFVVLPYQIPSSWWDQYHKLNGPWYMGFLHLGPSVAFFSLSDYYLVSLMLDIDPNIGVMSFHKGVCSGSTQSEAVNKKEEISFEHG